MSQPQEGHLARVLIQIQVFELLLIQDDLPAVREDQQIQRQVLVRDYVVLDDRWPANVAIPGFPPAILPVEDLVDAQLMDDIMLVWQARKVLPDVLALVLCPKGNMTVPAECQVESELGWTRAAFGWKVQEL